MSSGVDFDLPFPHRCSPDLETARLHNLTWLRSHGLLEGAADEDRFQEMALAEVSAYAYPEARGADLDVVTDAVTWIAIADDLLDRLDVHDEGALRQATAFTQACVDLVEGTPLGLRKPVEQMPLLGALADLLGRLADGMSTQWQRRFAQGLREWLWSSLDMSYFRPHGAYLSLHMYRILCRETNGNRFFFPLTERAGGFEVPTALLAHPLIGAVHQAADEMVAFVQAVHSARVEESRGDHHNLVLVLQHERRCSRQEAITAALHEIAAARDLFIGLTADLPAVYDSLGLTVSERASAERYINGVRDIVAAARDYGPESSRYTGV
ncbi:terpene synthase family protein [Streptomyces tendae]|uniref:terpene synthase family protein n=1 Tax=Streptomyces tendae TaxID=1932 RepID=UPI0036B3C8B5